VRRPCSQILHTRINAHLLTYTRTRASARACVHTHTNTHAHTCTRTCTHVHTEVRDNTSKARCMYGQGGPRLEAPERGSGWGLHGRSSHVAWLHVVACALWIRDLCLGNACPRFRESMPQGLARLASASGVACPRASALHAPGSGKACPRIREGMPQVLERLAPGSGVAGPTHCMPGVARIPAGLCGHLEGD